MASGSVPADLTVEAITDWLYCLRTPVVTVYAIRQSTGFILVDSGVVGYESARRPCPDRNAIATMSGEHVLGVVNADPEQASDSFRRLAELPVSIVCGGHGPRSLTARGPG